jgi:hypothetical protein
MSVVEESDIWVNVCTATTAARNNLVVNNRDIILIVMQRSIRLDNEREWKLRFLEDGVGAGDSVEG